MYPSSQNIDFCSNMNWQKHDKTINQSKVCKQNWPSFLAQRAFLFATTAITISLSLEIFVENASFFASFFCVNFLRQFFLLMPSFIWHMRIGNKKANLNYSHLKKQYKLIFSFVFSNWLFKWPLTFKFCLQNVQ